MAPSKGIWLLLSALIFQGLLMPLAQAYPLLPEPTASNASRFQSASATEERVLADKTIALDGTSTGKATDEPMTGESKLPDLGEHSIRVGLDLDMAHLKRPWPGFMDILHDYRLHKNVSQVFNHSAQEVIRKAGELKSSNKTRDRWVHPGFEWVSIVDTSDASMIIYSNLTHAQKMEIFTRVEKVSAFISVIEWGDLSKAKAERPGKATL